jgi:hypothetical protein
MEYPMKMSFLAVPLLTLLGLASPALADGAQPLPVGCNLTGHPADGDDACKAVRLAYRSDLSDCMARLETEAKANGDTASNNAHTYRARYQICDTETRAALAN